MSVNKTIGGLSVLSSANIKGCFSLPVWDSNAQTTKSACITDILSGASGIFVAGSGTSSSIRCGVNNLASGDFSVSLGGFGNCAGGAYSAILGGQNNKALGIQDGIVFGANNCLVQVKNSFIIGGCYNRIVSNDDINLQSEYNTIGGGCGNSICGTKSILPTSLGYNCIGSGDNNCIYACSCNCTYAWFNTISNGSGNCIVTRDSGSNVYGSYQIGNDIFGGSNNCLLQVVCSTTDSGMYAVMESAQIFGGTLNKICTIIASTNTVGEAYSCNNTILGGHNNSIGLIDSPTIGSGVRMFNNAILTGYQNTITNNCYNNYGLYNVVVGGRQNIIGCSSFSSVTGGCRNIIISLSTHSSISGGISNTISSSIASAILGGASNDIASVNCSMAFGRSNVVAHNFAGVIGCGITSVLACALHTNRMVVTNMPTSSAGLPSGTLYSDAGTIKIVP